LQGGREKWNNTTKETTNSSVNQRQALLAIWITAKQLPCQQFTILHELREWGRVGRDLSMWFSLKVHVASFVGSASTCKQAPSHLVIS